MFVEKRARAFKRLEAHLSGVGGSVDCYPLHGEFGDNVAGICRIIGDSDPALIFVDPTGFKGVAMDYIATLARPRMRDVLINVMFNDVNRWKDDPRDFLRRQMREFFGLADNDLPAGLNESQLFDFYRENLKRRSRRMICCKDQRATKEP